MENAVERAKIFKSCPDEVGQRKNWWAGGGSSVLTEGSLIRRGQGERGGAQVVRRSPAGARLVECCCHPVKRSKSVEKLSVGRQGDQRSFLQEKLSVD